MFMPSSQQRLENSGYSAFSNSYRSGDTDDERYFAGFNFHELSNPDIEILHGGYMQA